MICIWRFSLCALLLILSCSGLVSAQTKMVNSWLPEYRQYYRDIETSPEDVLSALQQDVPSNNPNHIQAAQYQILLSRSYHALSFADKALTHARNALSLITSEHQPWLFHTAQLAHSKALAIANEPRKGLVGANAAIIWGEINGDKQLVIEALFVRGTLLSSLADSQGALRDLQRAYELASEVEGHLLKGTIAGALADVHDFRREYQLAIPYYEKAVSYHRQAADFNELSLSLFGLGKANKNLGNLELAKRQLTESLILAQQYEDMQGVAFSLVELADIEKEFKNYSTAMTMLNQAVAIFIKSQNLSMLVASYEKMALLGLATGDKQLANDNLVKAKQVLNQTPLPLRNVSVQETAAELLYSEGEYKLAFELLESTLLEKERILSQQNSKQLLSLRSQYEIDVRERENKLLEQENKLQQSDLYRAETANTQLQLLFGSTLIICALLIMLAYRAKQHRITLEELANTDGLTGLLNRRRALEMIEHQVELAKRHNYPVSIAIADIDLFKNLNDTYGHAAGDRVLKAFGNLCTTTFRNTDIVGRIGGEEFVIVLPHTEISDAQNTLQSLSEKFKELASSLEIDKLSISCGLAQFESTLTVAETMLKCDQALYNAKNQGRDRVMQFQTLHSSVLEPYGGSPAN